MQSVLGIDAAWTAKNPSGVALAISTGAGWNLVCVECSYGRFQRVAAEERASNIPSSSHEIDVDGILHACKRRHDVCVDLVAVDMPLSSKQIKGRRAADDAVSKEYGGRQAGTHTPSIARPGLISEKMTAGFALLGYELQTQEIEVPALIEVYPHPALLELTGEGKRLPYKYAKCRSYWPGLPSDERRSNLIEQWRKIVCHLEEELEGVKNLLPLPAVSCSAREFKSYEDKLDAVVCAWVGICALTGRAKPFGDADAAIWIPVLH